MTKGDLVMLLGRELMEDIEACSLYKGQAAFWWLGQHSFIIKLGRVIILADPFLTPMTGRQAPPLLKPVETRGVGVVLGSHDHADHIDQPAWPRLAAANPEAVFVVPAPVADGLRVSFGWDSKRLRGLADGTSLEIGGVTIDAIPAAHERLVRDPVTGASPFVGFILRGNGVCLYHAGDTCLYEGIQGRLRAFKPDVMFLPINGRDALRLRSGCIGNMTYQEAADLAGDLEPALTVPAHFDMFIGNTEDPGLFDEYMAVKYPKLKSRVPMYGERVVVSVKGI